MAVKRSLKITSAIGAIDRRIKSLESTSNLSLPAGAVSPELDTTGEPGNNNRSVVPPDTFKRIIGARVYGPAATGNFGTRVELYFNETPEELEIITETADEENPTELLEQRIQVYGVNGYSDVSVNLSSGRTFLPIEVARDDPDWADYGLRDTANQTTWRQTPPVSPAGKTVNSTIWYNPTTQNPDTTDRDGKDIPVTRAIDSASVSGANVLVTFNASSHLYKVGDIIAVDLPAPFNSLDYYGNNEPDGLFEITAVTSNTISYQLDAPVAPTTYTYTSGTRYYAYAVARGFRPDGDIWIDEATDPNTVWVWKKFRWYNTADPIGDVTATQDGIAPSPVTNLVLDSEVPAGDTSPNIVLTWTSPTTRSNGAPISGFLSGYEIWYKKSTDATWKTEFVRDTVGTVTTHTLKDPSIVQNRTYNIRVYVVDIMSQVSTAASDNILTATFSEVLNPPSKPLVSSRLGTIKITWDGDDSTGNLPVPGVLYIEFHASNTSGFTPSDATLVGTAPSVIDGNYIVLSDLIYGTNYFFKTIFVRRLSPIELDKSLPSVQSDAIQVAQLVNTDIIANTISGAAIQSGTITASDKIIGNTITGALIQALAIDTGQLKANAITADKIEGGAISGVVIRGDVIKTANTGTRVELSNTGIYAYDGNTPVFSFNTSTASLTIGGYATDNTVSAVSAVANAKLDPANVISEINSRHTTSGTSTTTTISGGAIRTGTVDAGRITVTDTFRYTSTDQLHNVYIGGQVTGNSSWNGVTGTGISFQYSGSFAGYLASFNSSTLELGRDYNDAYISLGEIGTNSVSMGFSSIFLLTPIITTTGLLTIETASATALRVGQSSAGSARYLEVDTIGRRVTVSNGSYSSNTDIGLYVFGTIQYTGLITDVSARRYKTDLVEIPVDYRVLDIPVYRYTQKNDEVARNDRSYKELNHDMQDTIKIGMIAEDFDELGYKEIVGYNADGVVESLDYSKITPLLFPIIKQLKLDVDELKKRLES